MNAAQNKPRLSALLGQVATIAKVSTTALGLKRHDKQASIESDRAHNALVGSGKTLAPRLAGAEGRVKEVVDLGKEAQNVLIEMTTSWGDRQRLLANDMIQPFLIKFTPIKDKYDRKLAQLIEDAPALIAAAEENKGRYHVEVPTVEEFRQAFSLEFTMSQIPDSATFAANGVERAMQEEMRRHFEAGIEAAYANATNDALTRVAEPLEHLVDRLGKFEQAASQKERGVISGPMPKLYETTVTHVQDIAKVFRSFNLTDNKLMNSVADRLEAFEGIEVEDLKKSQSLRQDTVKKAAIILADLKDLI